MTSTPALSTSASTVLTPTSASPASPVDLDDDAFVDTEETDEPVAPVTEAPISKEGRLSRLTFLLEQSSVYSTILAEKMERQRQDKLKAESRAAVIQANKDAKAGAEPTAEPAEKVLTRRGDAQAAEASTSTPVPAIKGKKTAAPSTGKAAGKRKAAALEKDEVEDELDTLTESNKSQKTGGSTSKPPPPVVADGEQPALVTGATMKDYQLNGLQWMVSLYENGLNGILADEMGLGKTLQTIAFFAHLKSKGVWGPFLVVCPATVLHNWTTEFARFTPDIEVVEYYGTPLERQELRRTRLSAPSDGKDSGSLGFAKQIKPKGKKAIQEFNNRKKATRNTVATFPIVITTYETVIKDAAILRGFKWKYIVVDEGHRLKNMNCQLVKELKTYDSANRLILTGTPLHNNLAELWSLLNFILPDIFDDLDSFQQWFNLDSDIRSDPKTASAALSSGESTGIVARLHAILKPFLLRRLKVDVEKEMPPKKEYLLHAPVTSVQKELYENVVNRTLRTYLVDKKINGGSGVGDAIAVDDDEEEVVLVGTSKGSKSSPKKRATRSTKKKTYHIESDDDEYFDQLESGMFDQPEADSSAKTYQAGKEFKTKAALKVVNNMKLQNVVMQLRKVASHPFLFDWPIDPETGSNVINEDLVNASGKMLLLNRLLDELHRTGHKVLVFSQFTTMLDIIEDWAVDYKGLNVCRIDGSTPQVDRQAQMKAFNEGGDSEEASNLFLLSTRAGGLGINLVAADTVIFFDSDWNPQADLQAMDRAHRIGQTKPVLVFRLVTAHTIEDKILARAGAKRKLEAMVIAQGKFKGDGAKEKKQSALDEAANLLRLEGENITLVDSGDKIISDEDLANLLDRSPEAYARTTGWKSTEASTGKDKKAGENTVFTVFEPARDDVNDGLAKMKAT